jgi:hypothetical protein
MRETTICIYLFTLAYLCNSKTKLMVLVKNNSDMLTVRNIGSDDGLLSHNAHVQSKEQH